MTAIARLYGVRDLQIAQACDYSDIARPPSGYWQKLAHGTKVQKTDLSTIRFSADKHCYHCAFGRADGPHLAEGRKSGAKARRGIGWTAQASLTVIHRSSPFELQRTTRQCVACNRISPEELSAHAKHLFSICDG
jgi:hypothetical protein